jgi:hypothetical protein
LLVIGFDEQLHLLNIPPTTRKRTAAEATITKDSQAKRLASAGPDNAAAPPTPLTAASNTMDSEDDFMSPATSDDDVLQDSDNDDMSGAEGECTWFPPPKL